MFVFDLHMVDATSLHLIDIWILFEGFRSTHKVAHKSPFHFARFNTTLKWKLQTIFDKFEHCVLFKSLRLHWKSWIENLI